MRKTILIAGPWRTGTTALFNLVRVMCSTSGSVYSCFEDQYDAKKAQKADWVIIKAHKFKPALIEQSDYIFTTYREPEDMWESMKRFMSANGHDEEGKRKFEVEDVWRSLAWWGLYQQYTHHLVFFNQLGRSPEKVVREIAKIIKVRVTPRRIVELWQEIKPPKTGFDPVTLLHANHITK